MIQYVMHSVVDILKVLSDGEKVRLITICGIDEKDDNFKMRKQFVKEVLIQRIGWKIEGWDFMQYCMRLTIVGNKLITYYDRLRMMRIMG